MLISISGLRNLDYNSTIISKCIFPIRVHRPACNVRGHWSNGQRSSSQEGECMHGNVLKDKKAETQNPNLACVNDKLKSSQTVKSQK